MVRPATAHRRPAPVFLSDWPPLTSFFIEWMVSIADIVLPPIPSVNPSTTRYPTFFTTVLPPWKASLRRFESSLSCEVLFWRPTCFMPLTWLTCSSPISSPGRGERRILEGVCSTS